MLTIPAIIGIIWFIASFTCLFSVPFVVLAEMVIKIKKSGFDKHKILKLVLIQILIWVSIILFINLVFGGFWIIPGILGSTFTIT